MDEQVEVNSVFASPEPDQNDVMYFNCWTPTLKAHNSDLRQLRLEYCSDSARNSLNR